MKDWKFKHLFIVTIGVLLISLVGVTSCLENEDNSSILPEFKEPTPPPIEVAVDQLYEEYMADEVAADAKYKWKRLLFTEVEVEEVVGRIYWDRHGKATFLKVYFTSGHVKFKEVQDFFVVMQNINVGYVLNIVGECRGMELGFITISDCWVESIVGDLGKGGQGVDFY